MKFKHLSFFFEKIEETASRLVITEYLADLFKEIAPEQIDKTVYLLQGRIRPSFESLEFGVAEKTVVKSILSAFNLEKKLFDSEYRISGDIGKTAEKFKKEIMSLEEKDLSIDEVYRDFYRLATSSGNGSQEVKINILAHLLRQSDPLSCRYLVRIPLGIMRLGFSDMTVLDALSWMIKGDKSLRPVIEKAYHVRPDLGFIARTIKEKGVDGLNKIGPEVFTPIIMMRAERLSSGQEIVDKIGRCAVEPKYDGFRLQVHYKNDQVKLYSRNLEEVSYMYPDIIEGVKKEVRAKEIVFEGEAVGFDPKTEAFLPFQETVQRKRKYDIESKAKEIPLKLFAFELLYKDGENLVGIPYDERRKKLEKSLEVSGKISQDTILLAPGELTDEGPKIELLFDEAIAKGLEGIIAKKLDGIYQPGARGWNWIKFKRSYSSKIDDTIDCLVMGYDVGKGKRAGFGIGAFLVGVYDTQYDRYVTVAKIGTGLTDEEWQEIRKRCDKIRTDDTKGYEVDKMMSVDVWVKPSLVVEIKADEITKSPVHTAGRSNKNSSGLALRFPRLVRFRDDKNPQETTTLTELEEMFAKQNR